MEGHLGAGGCGVAAGLLQQLHVQLIPQLRPLYSLYRQPSRFLFVPARSISHKVDACMCHKGTADSEVRACKACHKTEALVPSWQSGRSLSHLVKQLLHQLDLCSAYGRFSVLRHVFLDARKHFHSPRAVVRAQLQQRCGDAVLQVSILYQNLRLTLCADMMLLVCCPCSGAAELVRYISDC